jgi:hypothetical protein
MDIKTIIRKVVGKMTVQKPEDVDSSIDLGRQKIRTVKSSQAPLTLLQNISAGIYPPAAGTTITGLAGTGANSTLSNPYYGAVASYNSAVSNITPQNPNTSAAMVFYGGSSHKEIVRLNPDGSVTWADGINVPEASQAFERSLRLGAERSAGITYGVKQRIRDAVFEELIEMANSKGTLSVDDLTYLHQAAKIMDKLKGIKE